jgi:transposase-like protein
MEPMARPSKYPVEFRERAVRDAGQRPGLTTSERERLKVLERENRELKRANDILRTASAFFAQAELDRRSK